MFSNTMTVYTSVMDKEKMDGKKTSYNKRYISLPFPF